jgi:hypothetical protein
MRHILENVVGALLAAFILYFVLPWLSAIMLCLRMGEWRKAWDVFCGKLDRLDLKFSVYFPCTLYKSTRNQPKRISLER